jgi:ribosomal-protein-alanine N-acetyltransferase
VIHIRRIAPRDLARDLPRLLPRILRIERACFGQDAWPAELFRHYMEHPVSVFLIAVTATRMLGYARAVPVQSAWSLDSIAVAPRAQGRGVATRLLRRLFTTLTRLGGRRLTLRVRMDNAAALHLYQKLGFRRTHRIDGYYEDGSPAWRMVRKLGALT